MNVDRRVTIPHPLTIEELFCKASSLLTSYHNDLVIDQETLSSLPPSTPFILAIRPLGTHLFPMYPLIWYPPKGALTSYLFSDSTREHILSSQAEALAHLSAIFSPSPITWFYYDGDQGWETTEMRAIERYTAYVSSMISLFSGNAQVDDLSWWGPQYIHIVDDNGTASIKDNYPSAAPYSSFLVSIRDGSYTDIWGLPSTIPWTDSPIDLIGDPT